jgi:hypothetical protein
MMISSSCRTLFTTIITLLVVMTVLFTVSASKEEDSSSSSSAFSFFSSQDNAEGEEQQCVLALRLLAFDKEIELGELMFPDAGLSTFRYNLYDVDDTLESLARQEQPKPLGIYIGASHTVHKEDCIGTGSFNFDYNVETDSYDSQIYVSVSCSGTYNAVTGGTGRYAYIKNGHEVIANGPADIAIHSSVSELHFTSDTCITSPSLSQKKDKEESSSSSSS